ncbi:SAM-dependent methyltransferase [Streptomyces boncukensis]|uniref:Class I SAM-dependent methyltransferase n=1 Tax=Streptomyces boncukensis TaxID=2711219 RepID=A0A6G4WNX6_9ACTN|nr:cyclopropane-fatty-acyl-phospholipid synthase family protein [Streptomyces boncukensis]NGO66966.1 class I SAM-dependent methyltransferase [Streptomyces boncukensis]
MTGGTPAYAGASQDAIQGHYDIGNDFYGLWLDETRSYSCALWDRDTPTLRAAQERKLDYLVEQARAAGARRVLDIGCGWGGLMRRMVETHGVRHATGLTLSDAQAEEVRRWADARYDVRVENWTEHTCAEPYDAIISIGAFEHFADFGLGRAGRIAAYRAFFERCRAWLPPGGRLALQTNVKGNNVRLDRKAVRDLLFIVDRIFPESELPWTSEIIESSERLFDVLHLRNDPEHYARTCGLWLQGLRARREEALALVGPQVVADYERYLEAAVAGFTQRHLGLVRIVLERV